MMVSVTMSRMGWEVTNTEAEATEVKERDAIQKIKWNPNAMPAKTCHLFTSVTSGFAVFLYEK